MINKFRHCEPGEDLKGVRIPEADPLRLLPAGVAIGRPVDVDGLRDQDPAEDPAMAVVSRLGIKDEGPEGWLLHQWGHSQGRGSYKYVSPLCQ